MSEENVFGFVSLPGGWKKTIDDSNEVVKAYSEKFADDSEVIEIATVTEKLQEAFDALLEEGASYTFEEIEKIYSQASDAVLKAITS